LKPGANPPLLVDKRRKYHNGEVRAFHGNGGVVATLEEMARNGRIPQTLLVAGPEGIGKATLARRFAVLLLGGNYEELIERDDLSLAGNQMTIAEREKLPAAQRNQDPLLFGTHPDFVTFPPDGPLRQITIQQMRLLKERAPYKPMQGRYRVFLIDHIDRANEQAANSLLKTLEEPPEHLILFLTAENAYDLLPTIRSRAVPLYLAPLADAAMREFLNGRGVAETERRIALGAGSPGMALSLDLETYDRRRAAMLALIESASGMAPFGAWARHSEKVAASRSEKLDALLKVLYILLEDLLVLAEGGGGAIRNVDIRTDLERVAARLTFEWIVRAVRRTDELVELVRRNIQKTIALDALVLDLRPTG
jgi:DNA polymerase III subunit delta'